MKQQTTTNQQERKVKVCRYICNYSMSKTNVYQFIIIDFISAK